MHNTLTVDQLIGHDRYNYFLLKKCILLKYSWFIMCEFLLYCSMMLLSRYMDHSFLCYIVGPFCLPILFFKINLISTWFKDSKQEHEEAHTQIPVFIQDYFSHYHLELNFEFIPEETLSVLWHFLSSFFSTFHKYFMILNKYGRQISRMARSVMKNAILSQKFHSRLISIQPHIDLDPSPPLGWILEFNLTGR